MDGAQFIGLNELDPLQQEEVRGVVGEFLHKFRKILPEFKDVIVHIKQYGKGGNPKFSVHLRLNAPAQIAEASADDLILTKGVHAAFDALQKQVAHLHR